ncbi:hypothetical protein RFI_36850, partial [Reticulomyxa filosa]
EKEKEKENENTMEMSHNMSSKSGLPANERWGNLLIPTSTLNTTKKPTTRQVTRPTSTPTSTSRPTSTPTSTSTSTSTSTPMSTSTSMPMSTGKQTGLDTMFNSWKQNESNKIEMPSNLISEFIKRAERNTRSDVETCGILTGRLDPRSGNYKITHVILPKQNGTSNTVHTVNEEELIDIQEKLEIITVGWIHTHPSQTCFLSSIDLHCQLSYQIMFPEAIAIVHAPRDKTLTFSLTKMGLDVLSKCEHQGFHRHSVDGLYETAKHVVVSNKYKVEFIDLRNK